MPVNQQVERITVLNGETGNESQGEFELLPYRELRDDEENYVLNMYLLGISFSIDRYKS